jgi:hypothetical protein
MKSAVLRLLAVLLFLTAATPLRAADPSREYIIIAGGVSLHIWEKWKAAPHDGWWMNFIRASRIRIQQFHQEFGPDLNITMLVYRPSYVTRGRQDGEDHLSKINSVRDAYRIKLVYFDSTSELLNYINAGQPRDRVKIASLEYFGHSNKACFMFDYSNDIDSASKCWLHEKELGQIRRGIFTKDAFVKSWGCHTGESFSKKWRSATGVPMIGAVGKTQYMNEVLPILSTAGGRWTQ